MNDGLMKVWARILNRFPGGGDKVRLVLKSRIFSSDSGQLNFSKRLSHAGIDLSRVELNALRPTTAEHMMSYAELDISMDCFPYSGTTTTCESMWMGVPVVTLVGDRHSNNVSGSILSAVGLGENICSTEDQYVERVVYLIEHPEVLETISGSRLRTMMLQSSLCDGRDHTKHMEILLNGMMEMEINKVECETKERMMSEAKERTMSEAKERTMSEAKDVVVVKNSSSVEIKKLD
jgi:predicted O-linked N-acetylglucosamine transferase (SPINDLY family)